jgi:hypothetical protein
MTPAELATRYRLHAADCKITGRKRHILVDTLGLLLNVVVHSARRIAMALCSSSIGAHAASFPSLSVSSLMPPIRERKTAAAIAKNWHLEAGDRQAR